MKFWFVVFSLLVAAVIAAREQNSKRKVRKTAFKYERRKKFLSSLEDMAVPANFLPDKWCKPHNVKGPAVLTAAMAETMTKADARAFCGSLRKTGYTGDLVVAVLPNSEPNFLKALHDCEAIVYTVNPICEGEDHDRVCSFDGKEKFSINMIRYYLYQWWAKNYDEDALLMISDFRDVFFQKNPFEFHPNEWGPPRYQLAVFQEVFPNKVIYRCPFNSGWVRGCYGRDGLDLIKHNTVSCSGVSMGIRDAIFIYSYLMVRQLDPAVRYERFSQLNSSDSSFSVTSPASSSSTPPPTNNKGCISLGMDQGFHNWLLYSGQLDRYLDIRIFPQGEGPVNTVGAFFGERAVVKLPLTVWGVLKGEPPHQAFYNWNGEKSPVIHQADRFLGTDLKKGYEKHLDVLNDIYN